MKKVPDKMISFKHFTKSCIVGTKGFLGIFTHLTSVPRLFRNKIKRLDSTAMKQLDTQTNNIGQSHPFKVNLNYNPWTCDCYLRPFVDWVKNTRTKLHQEVTGFFFTFMITTLIPI